MEPAPRPPAPQPHGGAPVPAPDTEAGGQHRAPQPRMHTRRWVLAGGVALVVGGAAGVAAETVRRHLDRLPTAPADLVGAAAAERSLIADLDATTGGDAGVRSLITQLRADHARHLAAIDALLADYLPTPAPARRRGSPRTVSQLRSAERAAARAGGRRAAGSTGARAALLASVAACEASHAELLA